MILMPGCLAHLKPSMAIIHLHALCTLGFCSALHSCLHLQVSLHLTLSAQGRASAQRYSSPLSPLFTTLTAWHRCAPLLPPITGRSDKSAVRLAPEASHTVLYG